MERYLSANDIAEILGISNKSAYKLIHRIPHLPQPLRVSERVFKQWLADQTVYPVKERRRIA